MSQVNRGMGRTSRDVQPLSQSEAVDFLQTFRSSRGGSDSIFNAELIHFPRRESKVTIPITVYSGWQGSTLALRIEVGEGDGRRREVFLFRGGVQPQGWALSDEGEVYSLTRPELIEPLLSDMELSAFDLTAPYLEWPTFSYVESERVADSPAHWFRFEPPEDWVDVLAEVDIAAIQVALDARFEAPVRVEYLDNDDDVIRSLEVRSFKKEGETWFVKRLEGFDEKTRDRTELRIESAQVDLTLDRNLFLPDSLQ